MSRLDQKSNFLEVVIFMSKYTFKFKKKVVLEYLNGCIAYIPLAKKYGIKSEANIIFKYNPRVTCTHLKVLGFTFIQTRFHFDARRPLNGLIFSCYFPNGSLYSFTDILSFTISWASCSLMYFLIVLSFTPTVLTQPFCM